jgi:FkbM family methyltransferase
MINERIEKVVRLFLPPLVIAFLKFFKEFKNFKVEKEERRIGKLPRFQIGTTKIMGKPLKFCDNASFLFIYNEVFKKEVYKFSSTSQVPYIIDAGANVGLSVIYFKQIFPDAEIVAIEPDIFIFDILKYNIDLFEYSNIKLVKRALWNVNTVLKFHSEGADGGRISTLLDTKKVINVQTDRLYKYLDKKVDFLKMDIEGAEYKVLEDSKEYLKNVQNIFVEYHSFIEKDQELPELLDLLRNAGFRLSINTPGLVSGNPLIEVNSYLGMDMQLNIYGYRV